MEDTGGRPSDGGDCGGDVPGLPTERIEGLREGGRTYAEMRHIETRRAPTDAREPAMTGESRGTQEPRTRKTSAARSKTDQKQIENIKP